MLPPRCLTRSQLESNKMLVNQANIEHKFLMEQQAAQLALEHKFKVKQHKINQKNELRQIELMRKETVRPSH